MLQFADAEAFVDHILSRYCADMRCEQVHNYDWGRFSADGIDRSAVPYDALHIAAFKALLRHSEAMFAAWCLLEDAVSRELFIDLVRYRLAGHRRVKLPTNNPDYWSLGTAAQQAIKGKSPLPITGQFGEFWHCEFPFEGKQLRLDCCGAVPFFTRQYFYSRAGVRIRPETGDHVIDAGAGVGDTALGFGCAIGPAGRVYGFELLDSHLKVFAHNIAQNPGISEFALLDYGLSDRAFMPVARRNQDGYDFGFALDENNDVFPTARLDDLVRDGTVEKVDFIKMDIEGSEMRALRGAKETLRQFKPRLAISIYHDIAHFYEVPLFVHGLGLGYHFYLDHYTIHAGETVLYATSD